MLEYLPMAASTDWIHQLMAIRDIQLSSIILRLAITLWEVT